MSNTKKTANFIMAFFSTIMFISIVSRIIMPYISNLNENIVNNVVFPILLTIALLFFGFFQGLLRYSYNKKILRSSSVLLSASTDKFNLNERLWYYLLVALIYFLPILKNPLSSKMIIIRIILFIITLALIEVLLKLSNRTIKIYFLKNGILITGFDIRIGLPIVYGTQIHNDSGYYSYNDIENYFIFPDYIDLYLILKQGKLTFKSNSELARQVSGILKQNKIEMKKFT
ncbi:hypothetical protein SAMN02745135_00038 [Caloranaerobacter azorensis DSM 13643]|uniref:Uncharacterized protein n=1 Tax=Caloranaerobacter azorensis DSM 13643 TaxID=1121264 RepID=A0A1M5R1N8_9FIRM|nr:hypothetical protein [Caloranaerobacter azorensis]SHH20294.1 hypothetical protein SAMN02745135_00038 [Caloranaerobacter azorensis DSM 13643]